MGGIEAIRINNNNNGNKGEDDNRSNALKILFAVAGAYPGPGGQYLYRT